MATDYLPDEIVVNILARLPAKPLLRFRCLSKYWQSMLMDPYFMKLRSRKTIFFALGKTLHFIDDDNAPTDDNSSYSIFTRCYPFSHPLGEGGTSLEVIGSFSGLVVLVSDNDFILYNPFTGEYKKLPSPHAPIYLEYNIYGFGYGDTPHDLKIVRFRVPSDICDVYDFKTNLWSSWSTKKYGINNNCGLRHPVGTFVNGFLYWVKMNNELIVLRVKDMALSAIIVPCTNLIERLGTINGCLCFLKKITSSSFELWVRKEDDIESSWVNTHSFSLDFIDTWNSIHQIVNILDDGKILICNPFKQLILYDIMKSSYKTDKSTLFHDCYYYSRMKCVEYVETLVSPLDVPEIGWEKQ